MLRFDPNDRKQIASTLQLAVRKSRLTLAEIGLRLEREFGISITQSAISHVLRRGGINFQRALQILSVCGVEEVKIYNKKEF